MELFSEELAILDRNTVKYMIDEMQEEIDQQKAEIARQKEVLAEKDCALAKLREEYEAALLRIAQLEAHADRGRV